MFMVWTFNKNERMYAMLERYAEKMQQIGLFDFTVDSTGTIEGSIPERCLNIMSNHTNVTWLLTIQNLNTATAVVNALINDTDGARTAFFSNMDTLLSTYPQADGIDIDLENCGGTSNQSGMAQLIADIYEFCHERGKKLNVCFPPIAAPNNSIGGEYWCSYADYANTVDTMAIMSYGYAWSGSAPGPVSPSWWLDNILEYAVTVVPREKILIGLGGWAFLWALHQEYPTYRSRSGSFYWIMEWMKGTRNFFDFRDGEGRTYDTDRQPKIPFCAYWDDYEKINYIMPHVYDYANANQCEEYTTPLVQGVSANKYYLASYNKLQGTEGTYSVQTSFTNATTDTYSSGTSITSTAAGATWQYKITISTAGTYTVAIDLNFGGWTSNALLVTLDGTDYSFTEDRYHHPLFLRRHRRVIYTGTLSAGTHTIKCGALGSVIGVTTYGVYYGTDLNFTLDGGDANYKCMVRPFYSADKELVTPAAGYAITMEMLRSKPDSALIWYDSCTSSTTLSGYYTTSGSWKISNNTMVGKGTCILKGLTKGNFEAQIKFTCISGKVGLIFGNYYACYDATNKQLQIYNGSTLLKYSSVTLSTTSTISVRFRAHSIRIYTGSSKSLALTQTDLNTSSATIGIKCTESCTFTLFRVGDGWWMEPYECAQLTVNGNVHTLGRVERTNVDWDEELNVFKPVYDVEESTLREETFSSDYDYLHVGRVEYLTEGEEIEVEYRAIDINMRFSKMYIGDADGFGIGYFADSNVLNYWYNRARHHYGIKGTCMWSLGLEDCRVWETM